MRALIKHTDLHLYVPLTEMERKERAELLLRNLKDFDEVEQKAKDTAKAFKNDLDGIWNNVTAHRKAMENGLEQLVGCTEYLDESRKLVVTVRNDTGEEISTRAAMEEDYQAELTL